MNKFAQTIHQGIHNVCLIYNQKNLWNLLVKKFQTANTKGITDFIFWVKNQEQINTFHLNIYF